MDRIELLGKYPLVSSIIDLELDVGWDAGFGLGQRARTLRRKEWESLTIVAGMGLRSVPTTRADGCICARYTVRWYDVVEGKKVRTKIDCLDAGSCSNVSADSAYDMEGVSLPVAMCRTCCRFSFRGARYIIGQR